MITHWTNGLTPLRREPAGVKILDIPPSALVSASGEWRPFNLDGELLRWVQVTYDHAAGSATGWAYEGYLEPYYEQFPADEVPILNQTKNIQDGPQYVIWQGQTQYNLCGELAVCWCMDRIPLDLLLTQWQAKKPTLYQRVFGSGGRARGTDLGDLDGMLAALDYPTPCRRVAEALTDAVRRRPIFAPARVASLLNEYQIILSVRIDAARGNRGLLRGSGVLHWVVLDSVTPDGVDDGEVILYNPFPNRRQKYRWAQLINSMGGSPYGLAVPRNP